MGWRQVLRMVRMGPRATAAGAGLALALAALTAVVAAGKLTSADQYSLDHLMPEFHPRVHGHGGGPRGLVLPFGSDTSTLAKVLDVWVYPCSVLLSALVLAGVFSVLRRRGRPVAGLAWIVAWFAGNAVEVVGKGLISRPALYGSSGDLRIHVAAFDQSFPSGHTLRCAIIAGAVVFTWRRAARPALAWAVTVGPVLVVTGAHTPSDVVGGALLGLLVALVAWSVSDSDTGTPDTGRPGRTEIARSTGA